MPLKPGLPIHGLSRMAFFKICKQGILRRQCAVNDHSAFCEGHCIIEKGQSALLKCLTLSLCLMPAASHSFLAFKVEDQHLAGIDQQEAIEALILSWSDQL